MKSGLLLAATLLLATCANAQQDTARTRPAERWLKKNERFAPEIRTLVQVWGLYSIGMKVYDADDKDYQPVDDRFNVSIRRARFMVNGEPYRSLKYFVTFFYDQIGRDLYSSATGNPNRPDPAVGIWDAFFQWKILHDESLYLTAGFFRPQVQRESITAAWAVSSFEKSAAQNYLRAHLTGTGPGRATGINLGGLLKAGQGVNLTYNAGIFNPVNTGLSGGSAGKQYSPLLTGRLSLSLGDPELQRYAIFYDYNFYSQRKGISLDLNLARQGRTDAFAASGAAGAGFLLNYGAFNLDADWVWMQRSGERLAADSTMRSFKIDCGAGQLRLGVNLPAGRYLVEPMFMATFFKGAMDAGGQADATAGRMSAGSERNFDAGINWYLDGKNLKLALHYTWRHGMAGNAGDGAQVNAYFSQNGVGAIRRGNYAGLGLSAIF